MKNIIDYAGLFPPAELGMADAVREYLVHRKQAEASMLSHFICPAARLDEFASAIQMEAAPLQTIPLTALSPGAVEPEKYFTQLQVDIRKMSDFRKNYPEVARIDTLETRLPGNLPVKEYFSRFSDILKDAGFADLHLFFEPDLSADIEERISRLAKGVADFSAGRAEGSGLTGFKLRCGGVTPEAFPATEIVVFAIRCCRQLDIPFKATAGLHHPVRHFSKDVGTRMHGFLNVFGAVLLDAVHELDLGTLQSILEDEEPAHFRFSDEQFSWNKLTVSTEQIDILRGRRVISFGSCSFREPCDDLRFLKLLP